MFVSRCVDHFERGCEKSATSLVLIVELKLCTWMNIQDTFYLIVNSSAILEITTNVDVKWR